ncbi:Hypothetical predicted protein, partial [Scomber scombrus]
PAGKPHIPGANRTEIKNEHNNRVEVSASDLCVIAAVCQLNSCAHMPGRKQSDSFGTIEVQEKKRGTLTRSYNW